MQGNLFMAKMLRTIYLQPLVLELDLQFIKLLHREYIFNL